MKPTNSDPVLPASPLLDEILQTVRATALAAVRSALPITGVKEVATSNIWPLAEGECSVRFVTDVKGDSLSLTAAVTGFNESGVRVLVYSQNSTTEAEALRSAADAANVVLFIMHESDSAMRFLNAVRLMDDLYGRSISLHGAYPAATFFDAKAPLLASLRDAANKAAGLTPPAPAPAPAPRVPEEHQAVSRPQKRKYTKRKSRRNAAPVVTRACANCGKEYTLLKRLADTGGHLCCSKTCSYQYRTAKSMLTRAANKAARAEAAAAAAEAEAKSRYPYTSGGFPTGLPVAHYPSVGPEGGIHSMPVHLPPQRRFDKYGYERPPSGE